MKIIEVRDGFIKFEADDSIYLSSFIQIDGMDKSYVAQVNKLSSFGNIHIADAKILFTLIGEELYNYDKTEPSKDADIKSFPFEVIQSTINAKKPIIVGKTLKDEHDIFIDISAFNKNLLVSIDNNDLNNLLVNNFAKQFTHHGIKTVAIDSTGTINGKKYYAGKDFKLPLNTDMLMFLYKSCLNDATEESKSTIVEIFKDLSEYSKTVPFLPFFALKSIIDDMVDNQHIFKLLVLKNKLSKFEKLGYFATKQEEADSLEKILESDFAILDLSKLDPLFLNCYLEYIYSKIPDENTQVLVEASSSISKKNLKTIISDSNLASVLITRSTYPFLSDIKNMFKNFVIEPTPANKSIFKLYGTFFGSMEKNTYLVAGEDINYIPIASSAKIIDKYIDFADDTEEKDLQEIAETNNVDEIQQESENITNIPDSNNEETFNQNEIMASIDKKSESIINTVSQELEEENKPELFSDDIDDTEDTQNEEIPAIKEEIDDENITEEDLNELQTVEDTNEDSDYEEELISEMQDDSIDEELEDLPSAEAQENLILEDEQNNDIETIDDQSVLSDTEDLVNIEDTALEEYTQEDSTEISLDEMQDNNSSVVNNTELDDMSVSLDNDDELLLQEDIEEEENLNIQDFDLNTESEDSRVIPITSDDFDDSIIELDSHEASDDDIIIDISSEDETNINEDIDQQIKEDVDKVYSSIKEEDELEEFSDSDLDLIDQLNSNDDLLEEVSDGIIDDGILEQPQEKIVPQRQKTNKDSEILEKRDSNTPIVPVYDADIPQEDLVISDAIQQGDSVFHTKYGNGVVEKMIKYGNKTLFSINFENIGRRLLDPTLTEIKKL